MMMNRKTIITNLLLILLLQISSFSTNALTTRYKKDYKSEFSVKPGTITNIVVSNELYGLKNGNAGFVCAHGPKIWRKSKPGDRYNLLRFETNGVVRFNATNCHVRSSRGFVNFHVFMQPDTSARCYPSYICQYSIRKDGVHYKHDNMIYEWRKYTRLAKGRRSSKA